MLVRIKVFSERGRESQSKIDIPFLSNWKIQDIAARTIKPEAGFEVDEIPDPLKLDASFGSYNTTYAEKIRSTSAEGFQIRVIRVNPRPIT